MKTTHFLLLSTMVLALLYSCANIKPPSGGPIDDTPPNLDRATSTPDSLHLTNFTGQRIILEFNEPIAAQNLTQHLIISPPIQGTYKHSTKILPKQKGRLTIDFEEPFAPNTTYTLNFGSAIQDITQKNKQPNLNFAFSTGEYLDSLELTGTVRHAHTGSPEPNTLVGLYRNQDSISYHAPDYYVQTNDKGQFHFNYLGTGPFYIRSFNDLNNNQRYDPPNESISFLDSPISPLENTNIELYTFHDNPFHPMIIKRSTHPYCTELTINKGLKNYTVHDNYLLTQLSEDGRTLTIFPNRSDYSPESLSLSLQDSINQNTDTILSEFSIRDTLTKKKPKDFRLITQLSVNQLHKSKKSHTLHSNYPISTLSQSHISIISKDDTVQLLETNLYTVQKGVSPFNVSIHYNNPKKRPLAIQFHPKSITTPFHDSIPNQTITLNMPQEENQGLLAGTLTNADSHYILQLITSRGLIIAQQTNAPTFLFNNLPPDTYTFRYIHDANADGKWTPGNLKERKQPEIAIQLGEPYKLKANWEIQNIQLTIP